MNERDMDIHFAEIRERNDELERRILLDIAGMRINYGLQGQEGRQPIENSEQIGNVGREVNGAQPGRRELY